jgi:hypothetical protein
MSLLKLPSGAGDQQSPSEIVEQSHAFVTAATRLRELHFEKAAAMLILANSAAVAEFAEAIARIRLMDVDQYVMENLIQTIWE